MENQNMNMDEKLPQAQDLQKTVKKGNVFAYIGLGLLIGGLIVPFEDLSMTLTLLSIVFNGIGLYKAFKHKKATKGLLGRGKK